MQPLGGGLRTQGGSDSTLPSTDLRELDPQALGQLLSSPAWQEALWFWCPRLPLFGGQLPG